MVKRRDVPTIGRELLGPWIGLPAVRSLRSHEMESHGFCTVEDSVVPSTPVLAAVLSVPTQNVEIARHENPLASPPSDQGRKVRQ